MKKIATALFALLAFAGVSFAQEFSVEGAATIKWGIDLDNVTSGFTTSLDNIQFHANFEKTAISTEDGNGDGMYGEIKIADLRVESDEAWNPNDWGSTKQYIRMNWGNLLARLVFSPNFSISYNDQPNTDMRYSSTAEGNYYVKNAYIYTLYDGKYGSGNTASTAYNSWEKTNGSLNNRIYFQPHAIEQGSSTNAGISADITLPKLLNVNVILMSYKSYDDSSRWGDPVEGTAGDNAYTVALRGSLKAVDNLTLDVGASFGFGYTKNTTETTGGTDIDGDGKYDKKWDFNNDGDYTDKQDLNGDGDYNDANESEYNESANRSTNGTKADPAPGFGIKTSYAIKIADGVTITPTVAGDLYLPDNTADGSATTDGVDFGLVAGLTAEFAKSAVAVNFGFGNDAASTGTPTQTMALTASANIGAVEGLTAQAAFEYIDSNLATTANETIGIHGKIGYAIPVAEKIKVAPWFACSADNKTGSTTTKTWYAARTDYSFFAKAGVDVTGLLESTTLFLAWDSNDLTLTQEDRDGDGIGAITLGATIKF